MVTMKRTILASGGRIAFVHEEPVMRCLNCNRDIPDTAKICGHCETLVVEPPTEEEMEAARAFLEQLPPDAAAELQQALLDSDTAEEFADRILVGNCPKCDGVNTGNCE